MFSVAVRIVAEEAEVEEQQQSKNDQRIARRESKTTNKKQLEMLLDAMQTHQGIACGMYKGSKEDLNRFWRNLEAELNSAGPRQKSVSEWKKVWCDQKKYVRQKAAQNLKSSKGTGGDPNMEQKFSGIEEAIYNLIGMKESVEGVANKFGLGGSYKNTNKQTDSNIENILEEILVTDDDSNEIQKECPSQPPAKKIKKTPVGLPHRFPLPISLQRKSVFKRICWK
ncbi:uncharacterized protein LOC124419187 [Lucilia cuprina]|uniref:uncharacterized protein LOC124419187 n=1 Tax=Lucilia cuprina TaxID=7375 RepID=UPI001F06DD53|nr:uncharacterized protein LOC124419187 [Lucilia cuprina]